MDLEELRARLAAAAGGLRPEREGSAANVEILDVQHDSRRVRGGDMFCCVPGAVDDGHAFAEEAVAAGAVALLCERPLAIDVPQLVVRSVREAMGPAAAAVHGHPSASLTVVGVTGTNGKTTTVHLLRSVLEAAGRSTRMIGTLTGARTTPEATDLQRTFAEFRRSGVDAVAMEVSSHALAQHRIDGTRFDVAVFTNLSREHLDYHRDMSSYFQAKARLFEPDLTERAVVNLDDPHGRLLLDAARVPTAGFSLDDASSLELGLRQSRFWWRGVQVECPLAGALNVSNALAAATAGAELRIDPPTIASGIAAAGPVPGRFEVVDAGQAFLVVVDYAHTPDGISQLVAAARQLAGDHRVILVFGAGGDRDRSKRPEMGRAAAAADVVIVTSDNPRSEDPNTIIDAVVAGLAPASDTVELSVEPDRRAAIHSAVAAARRGDIVLIAGKGHETTQIIDARELPFDDREVAREALHQLENA